MGETTWIAGSGPLHVEEVDGSIVVFDTRDEQVSCISGDAASVFRAAQGSTSAQIAAQTGLAEGVVATHLIDLVDRRLVTAQGVAEPAMARRALVGSAAGVMAAAAVWSIAAPSPAAASSQPEPTTTPY